MLLISRTLEIIEAESSWNMLFYFALSLSSASEYTLLGYAWCSFNEWHSTHTFSFFLCRWAGWGKHRVHHHDSSAYHRFGQQRTHRVKCRFDCARLITVMKFREIEKWSHQHQLSELERRQRGNHELVRIENEKILCSARRKLFYGRLESNFDSSTDLESGEPHTDLIEPFELRVKRREKKNLIEEENSFQRS